MSEFNTEEQYIDLNPAIQGQTEPQYSFEQKPAKGINKILFIMALVFLISIIVILSVFYKLQVDKTKEYKLETVSLKTSLQSQVSKTNGYMAEVDNLKTTLQSTEEGKKILESANASLDKKAKDAQTEAKDAQNEAKNANAKLTKAQADLNAKLAEVAKVNTELSGKQADLAKAQRGISKFAELRTLFNSYDSDAGLFMNLMSEVYTAILDNDYETAQSKADEMTPVAERLETEYTKIIDLFDVIEKGTY